MNIKFLSLHQVDHQQGAVTPINVPEKSDKLKEYIDNLIEEIRGSSSYQFFEFERKSTEVYSAIHNILSDSEEDNDEQALIIAKRLLQKEQEAQKAIEKLNIEILKGSLFQTIVEEDDKQLVIISKAEHSAFIDEDDFNLRQGLPWKKRVFKAFLAEIEDNEIIKVLIYDTNKETKYWWRDFLELKKIHTDEYNTERALDLLDKKIFEPIKKSYPADHTILRNSAIGYFRNNEQFDLDKFVNILFENYTPVDAKLKTSELIDKINKLPEKYDFDKNFSISKDKIKKRQVNKIHLTEQMDLVLKDSIEDLFDIVNAYKDEEGEKYISIRSDSGYHAFKHNKKS